MSNANKSAEAVPFPNERLERVVERVRHTIALAPWDFQARFFLAEALEHLGQVEDAVAALTEIICLDPNNMPARCAIHRLSGRGGERKED